MACPSSGSEWIELFNPGTTAATIQNWKVTDESGNSRTLSGTIPAGGWEIFSWSSSLLNNAGDSLTLTTDTGSTVYSLEYDSCTSGSSLVYVQLTSQSKWVAAEPTPRAANTAVTVASEQTTASVSALLTRSSATVHVPLPDTHVATVPPSSSLHNPEVLGMHIKSLAQNIFQPLQSFELHSSAASSTASATFVTRSVRLSQPVLLGAILSGIITCTSSGSLLYGKKVIEFFTTLG
jgi:hypothetical protein